MHILSLDERDFLQLTIDLDVNGHGIERLNGAQAIKIDRNVLLGHRAGYHRDRGRPSTGSGTPEFAGSGVAFLDYPQNADDEQNT